MPRTHIAVHASAVPHVHRVAAHLARRFHQVCLGALSEVTDEEGLTPLEYAVLASVDEAPGVDQRRLAARLAIDAVSAGQLVASLEQHGWIERAIDPSDRRARRVTLTSAGARLRAQLQPLLAKAQDRILAGLSATERKQLISLLARIVESNESYAKPGNGRRAPTRSPRGTR
jgi:DNA-binding MarR family transcriptional regulator